MKLSLHFLLLLLSLLLTGCQPNTDRTTRYVDTIMTMDYKIIIGEPLSLEQKSSVKEIIQNTFAEINTIYNKWNPDSEISKLNRLKTGEIATLSPELEQFLSQTEHIIKLTDGRFDPTIEPLQHLWKEKLVQGETPNDDEINAVVPALGWNKIHFGHGTFSKEHSSTQLDLGGIAKGYCVDLLVERLNAAGYPNLFVEWGGEIRASGEHPDRRPWRIFISRLGDTHQENAIATLDLVDQAIATSGDYMQFWTVEDQDNSGAKKTTYFHIFDPRTHRPLEKKSTSVASASVVAPTCMLADGLATAAMLFPSVVEAQKWAEEIKEKHPALEFWIVSNQKSLE